MKEIQEAGKEIQEAGKEIQEAGKEIQEAGKVTKNCVTCKWWDVENNTDFADGEWNISHSQNLPFFMGNHFTWDTWREDGQDCPTWEERKRIDLNFIVRKIFK